MFIFEKIHITESYCHEKNVGLGVTFEISFFLFQRL